MRHIRLFLALMLAALLVSGVSHHRALQSAPRQALDSTPTADRERPVKIIVADDRAYAPFAFLDPSGQPQGMTVDFWKLWSQKTRVAVEFRLLEWDAALAAVREGQADVVGGLFRTPQREKIFDFTEPYFTITTDLFFHSQIHGIRTFEDLSGFTVGVVQGDSAEEWIREKYPSIRLEAYPDTERLVKATLSGTIKVFVADTQVVRFYLAKLDSGNGIREADHPVSVNPQYAAVKKGHRPLLMVVQQGFAQISEPEKDAIVATWTGHPVFSPVSSTTFRTMLAGIAAMLVLLLLWNIQLRRKVARATRDLQQRNADLERSERNYREIFDATSDMIFLHDAEDGQILDLNRTAVELTGYSKGELVGQSVAGISAGSAVFNAGSALDQIRKAVTDGVLAFEWICQRRNGETFWAEVTLKSSRIGDQNRVLAVVRDINDRKKAEKTLAESEQKFRAIFDYAPYGIAINSLDGKYLDVNHACVNSLGLSKEALLSLRVSDVSQVTEAETATLMAAMQRDGVVRNLETTARHRDGSTLHILYSSVLLHIQNAAQILSMTVDITDKKRAEEALRKSEATLRSLFSAVPVGLITLQNRVFRSVNQGFCQIVGYSREELLGQSSRRLYASDEEFQRAGSLLYAALWEEGLGYAEMRFLRADGTWRDVSLHAAPLQPDDRSAGVAVAIQDITERKRTEEELQQHREHLEELVAERTAALEQANAELRQAMAQLVQSEKLAALGNLVAGIAHELNTPIGNAVMLASTLADQERSFRARMVTGLSRSALNHFVETVRENCDILQRNLQRAAELISSFKQVAVDQASYQCRGFALDEVVREIALALKPRLRRSVATLEISIAADLRLDSFPGPLGQVLMNLIQNALVHAFDGRHAGCIRIESLPAGPGCLGLRVSDDGNGIAPAHLRRIFDPFFTTRLGQSGSGLGLHIVYNLVTGLLGGTIEVHSIPGHGTEFLLELPLIAPQAKGKSDEQHLIPE